MTTPKGDPANRALTAYFATAARAGEQAMQPSGSPSVLEHKGKSYVVLDNVNGILAVYRIRPDGTLKRLVRYPSALAQR